MKKYDVGTGNKTNTKEKVVQYVLIGGCMVCIVGMGVLLYKNYKQVKIINAQGKIIKNMQGRIDQLVELCLEKDRCMVTIASDGTRSGSKKCAQALADYGHHLRRVNAA